MKISKSDLAYMAGILDGEGSISLTKHIHRGKHKVSVYRYVVIYIVNVYKELLEPFYKYFGGSFKYKKRVKPWRNIYCYSISGSKKPLAILKLLYPFMRDPEKRRRTELLFKYYSVYPKSGMGTSYTKKEIRFKQKLEREFFKNTIKKNLTLSVV
jgi:hypothetical protein